MLIACSSDRRWRIEACCTRTLDNFYDFPSKFRSEQRLHDETTDNGQVFEIGKNIARGNVEVRIVSTWTEWPLVGGTVGYRFKEQGPVNFSIGKGQP